MLLVVVVVVGRRSLATKPPLTLFADLVVSTMRSQLIRENGKQCGPLPGNGGVDNYDDLLLSFLVNLSFICAWKTGWLRRCCKRPTSVLKIFGPYNIKFR
ncbi:unnamed protein product [Acanthoscelides obtectus]|uniref:Uncharacterized protein n=1 Tax=Acanthoscelides obtectus TaxID=200917 RepID=A0A9P0KWX7_ACAOB|nr:unnamed protein product [Acanthoscelides obtectus]CAK1681315.1 hypothetical protein AOBTE_LOCUS33102 [Acanthoscelides obtectus]